MEPIHYMRALRRRWFVIIAAIAVAGIAAFVMTPDVSSSGPPVDQSKNYQATTLLLEDPSSSGSDFVAFGSLPTLIKAPQVAVIAAKLMGSEVDPLVLRNKVTAQVDPVSGFMDVSGFSSNPSDAEDLSRAFTSALRTYVTRLKNRDIDRQIRTLTESVASLQDEGVSEEAIRPYRDQLAALQLEEDTSLQFIIFQEPVAEELPVTGFRAPQGRFPRVLLALLLGLLAGLAIALLVERFDTKIRTRQRAEEHFDLPVVAEIPVIRRRERRKVSVMVNPTGKAADAFRLLGASVAGSWAAMVVSTSNGNGNGNGSDGPGSIPKTILVTSPGPGDGKTTVAANLAAAYGELGKRVTVISCDLRRPKIHRMFGVSVSPGLTDMLRWDSDVRPVAEPTSVANVQMIPSGRIPASPGELLGSERMRYVLEEVATRADVVILDCSSVLGASDIAPLVSHVDVVLLVGRAGKTRAELAERTTGVLRRLAAPVIGVALNAAHEIKMPTSHRRYRTTRQERRAIAMASTSRDASDER
jgi:capsular exopolysaccharide synthesis family protein